MKEKNKAFLNLLFAAISEMRNDFIRLSLARMVWSVSNKIHNKSKQWLSYAFVTREQKRMIMCAKQISLF